MDSYKIKSVVLGIVFQSFWLRQDYVQFSSSPGFARIAFFSRIEYHFLVLLASPELRTIFYISWLRQDCVQFSSSSGFSRIAYYFLVLLASPGLRTISGYYFTTSLGFILFSIFSRKFRIKKYFLGHLTSGRIPKVATSDGHHFSRKFPEKNCQNLNFWPFDLREGPQSGHFRWPPFCQDVSWEKLPNNKFLAIWPRGGSPKWPLPMATILPGSSLRKTDKN